MARKITREELIPDTEWKKLGLFPEDALLTYVYTDDKPEGTTTISNLLFEKEGVFYVEEFCKNPDGQKECVRYILSEEETNENVVSWLEDYNIYESQFSCDRNARFKVALLIPEEQRKYIAERFSLDEDYREILSSL